MPKATILVVDDEALTRCSLSERLKADAHDVEADTGRAAGAKEREGVETAVEAMKLGADHFANKPFNLDDGCPS